MRIDAIVAGFVFGYALASLPPIRSGLAFGAVAPIALAADTVMEFVDNTIMVSIAGVMDLGLGDPPFYAALAFLAGSAGLVAWPVYRWLIQQGKEHAVVPHHQH